MSITYSDLSNNFPDSLDTVTRMSDLSYEYKALADQYYTYLNAGNFTAARQLLTNNPTLNTMIINAEKINYYTDIAISLERFFKNDVETYLEARFSYIGTYASGIIYVKGNIVDLDGEGFICRVTSSVGVAPTAHTTTTNWAIIAKQGIQGASGTGLAPRGVWGSATTYYANDCVAHSNTLWQCLVGNANSEPASGNTNWVALIDQVTLPSMGIGYGVCSTPASTADKTVSVSGFILTAGGIVGVSFAYANSGSSPTLNINGTGSKIIYYNGAPVDANQIASGVYFFQYDGTHWQLMNPNYPITTVPITKGGTGATTASGALSNLGLGRSTTIAASDTNYSTVMARGIYAGATDMTAGSSSLTSGVIYCYYEA